MLPIRAIGNTRSGGVNQSEGCLRHCVGRQSQSVVRGDTMRKILTALVVAASISAAAIATSSNADAGWGWGPGAVVGGVIAGAVVGSAIASRPYYYPYGYYGYYGYGPYPYYGPPPCHHVWNGYAWVPAC